MCPKISDWTAQQILIYADNNNRSFWRIVMTTPADAISIFEAASAAEAAGLMAEGSNLIDDALLEAALPDTVILDDAALAEAKMRLGKMHLGRWNPLADVKLFATSQAAMAAALAALKQSIPLQQNFVGESSAAPHGVGSQCSSDGRYLHASEGIGGGSSDAVSGPDAAGEAAQSRLEQVMKRLDEMDLLDVHGIRVRLSTMERLEKQVYRPDGSMLIDPDTLENGALVSMKAPEYLRGIGASERLDSIGFSYNKRPLATSDQLERCLERVSELRIDDEGMISRHVLDNTGSTVYPTAMRSQLVDMEVLRIHALRRQIDPRARQYVQGWVDLEKDMAERITLLRTLFDRLGVPLR